jgi:hypothetical protein
MSSIDRPCREPISAACSRRTRCRLSRFSFKTGGRSAAIGRFRAFTRPDTTRTLSISRISSRTPGLLLPAQRRHVATQRLSPIHGTSFVAVPAPTAGLLLELTGGPEQQPGAARLDGRRGRCFVGAELRLVHRRLLSSTSIVSCELASSGGGGFGEERGRRRRDLRFLLLR